MDSSPDLSLKLRRGSSDSRDSFYMDFAQGIDSDIEEVTTTDAPSSSRQANINSSVEVIDGMEDGSVAGGVCGGGGDEGDIEDEGDDNGDEDNVKRLPAKTISPVIPPTPPPSPPQPPPPLSLTSNKSINVDISSSLQLVPVLPSPGSFKLSQKSIGGAQSGSATAGISTADNISHHSSMTAKLSRIDSDHHMSSIDESKQLDMHQNHHQRHPHHHHLMSQSILSSQQHHQQSQQPLNLSPIPSRSSTTQHLSVLYQSHHHHHLHSVLSGIRKPSRLPDIRANVHQYQEIKAGDALATTLSALYGKLLVIMGIAFPMAEVISTFIPPSFYESFYLYLYIGSMVFLLFMYATLLWGRPKPVPVAKTKKIVDRTSGSLTDSGEESDECGSSESHHVPVRKHSLLVPGRYHYGSFYLRMGAVAFGIGSMIYSGLEFGQYFELERNTKCHNVLLALTPATRMAFIFIQMYFIFLNNEQIKVYRHKYIARFGLMHMIGTNLSVWFSVLIQETKHEILTFYDPENGMLKISHRLGNKTIVHPLTSTAHLRMTRGLKGPHHMFECRRTNIIGTLVQDASPFLFPCTIEYSLICAAILYVMWRSISRPVIKTPAQRQEGQNYSHCKRSPHHYSVDCARAHKGLFVGILILVLTIISLILFFVLISRPEFVNLAVTEVNVCELALYVTSTIATLVGMVQVRHLQYDLERSFELDDILLVGAQTGSFLYSTFTVISGHFTMRQNTILVLIAALASLVQTTCQTMFILDASRRSAATPEHIRKKPGREIVTFLLVANLAMWAINTLEKSRAESHPIQLHFYGLWAWTIITHVSMPLAIFYRFHSTVCLCEIWKRAYKMKPAYM